MRYDKKSFKESFIRTLNNNFAMDLEESTAFEQYHALGNLVRSYATDPWKDTIRKNLMEKNKQVYYFSIEFLPGKLLKSNLLNLGILDEVKEDIEELGLDFNKILQAEPDTALGNGGLGRLASCFLDSMASIGMAGHGNGIRYRYGLFKQRFVDGDQVELPDNWLRRGNVWEVRKENKAVMVKFGGHVTLQPDGFGGLQPVYSETTDILAVPYDVPIIGYKNKVVNNLRLWSAEIPSHEDRDFDTEEERNAVQRITEVLYPDDSDYNGKRLRLEQEYFFVSAGIQSMVAYYKKYGLPLKRLPEKVAVHINDTHPALAIPELMRVLLDDEGLTWDAAWDITVKVMSYTNHTLLEEALERWPESMVKEVMPRTYQIIEEINRRFVATYGRLHTKEVIEQTKVISNGHIHMANLAIIGSHSVNGVARMHSDLLKEKVLNALYKVFPSRFNNKTNGITHRRWLELANAPLSDLLSETIGTGWKERPNELKMVKNYQDDPEFLSKLRQIKLTNKEKLANYVKEEMGIEIETSAIFDVQIKRLHAYKRQLLNILDVIATYLEIKDNPSFPFQPRVYIFGAKAAPSYVYAKEIIKLINEVAALINNDEDIEGKLKIVFIENYGVSLAELIIPAADISEQISLASKEASGTGNMKLMMNGAVTLATLDGANVEILESVGEENIEIFGLRADEVYQYYQKNNYNPIDIYHNNPVIHRVLNSLTDGTIPNITVEGASIFESLTDHHDEYFVLKDFDAYRKSRQKLVDVYQDKNRWARISLHNIAESGKFSSDYTVGKYADDIWDIPYNHNE